MQAEALTMCYHVGRFWRMAMYMPRTSSVILLRVLECSHNYKAIFVSVRLCTGTHEHKHKSFFSLLNSYAQTQLGYVPSFPYLWI